MTTNKSSLSTRTRKTLDQHNLNPLWEIEEEELGQTRGKLEAEIWKWENIQTAVDQMVEDIPQRSSQLVVVPVNPSYDAAISQTIYVGIQTVLPGETAQPHRHGGNVLRFSIDGDSEMKTVVGGEEFPMCDRDLITTPQWEWHGHANESDKKAIWLDVLDMPFILDGLNINNVFEAHDDNQQTINRPGGYYESQYSEFQPTKNSKIPGPFEGIREPTPPYRFSWSALSNALEDAENNEEAHQPHDGVVLEYTNPAQGDGPLFPTFGVRAQRLISNKPTSAHKHNATEVYYVIEGNGQTVVESNELNWSKRDIFVVPPSQTHYHISNEDSTLLNMTDRPLLEAINFYHETEKGIADN